MVSRQLKNCVSTKLTNIDYMIIGARPKVVLFCDMWKKVMWKLPMKVMKCGGGFFCLTNVNL